MKWDEFVKLPCELPEVQESTSYGRPSIKVRGKFMAGYNPNEKAFVLRIASAEEQDFLCEMAPEIFYVTDHYKNYPAILMRPGKLSRKEGRGRLRNAWRLQAPKALVKAYNAG